MAVLAVTAIVTTVAVATSVGETVLVEVVGSTFYDVKKGAVDTGEACVAAAKTLEINELATAGERPGGGAGVTTERLLKLPELA